MKEAITHPVPESEGNELQFTCPECGSDRLYAVQEEATAYTEISSISTDGWIDYGCQEFDDSDVPEDSSYQCRKCYYELKNETGRPIIGEKELIEWLNNNNGEQQESESLE